jgi:hypothetical protein
LEAEAAPSTQPDAVERRERLVQIIARDLRLSEEMASPPQDADAIPSITWQYQQCPALRVAG